MPRDLTEEPIKLAKDLVKKAMAKAKAFTGGPKPEKTYWDPQTGTYVSAGKPTKTAKTKKKSEPYVDPETGKKYFVHPKTGKKYPWDPGKAKKVTAKKPYTDPKTGKQYYVSPSGKLYPWDPEKAKPKEFKKWISAGGVVLDSMEDLDHVYIIKPSNNYGPWAFPKGRIDKGESMKQAAVREVWEETGLKAKFLPGRSYLGKGEGSFSITHFFLMVKTGGIPQRTDETEKVRLVTWEEAEAIFRRSKNKRDVKIARLAQKALKHYRK